MNENGVYIEIISGMPVFTNTTGAIFGYMIEGLGDKFLAITHIGCQNADKLITRCRKAWDKNIPVHIRFRDKLGIQRQSLIESIKKGSPTDNFEIITIFTSFPIHLEYLENLHWVNPPEYYF